MYVAVDGSIALAQICNLTIQRALSYRRKNYVLFAKVSEQTMVLVDEAYNEVTDDPEANSMIPLVKR